jgi:diguanylate cyclase (GGDEF)-like protein
MGQAQASIRIVTSDEVLLNSAQAATAALDGWEFAGATTVDDMVAGTGAPGDVVLIDVHAGPENAFESLRRMTGTSRARLFLVGDDGDKVSGPIAAFCGASKVLSRPVTTSDLLVAIEGEDSRPVTMASADARGASAQHGLPETMLQDLVGGTTQTILKALVDPETGLFNYEFLNFKLDEEFKRARRFGMPLSCVMLGFEGQATEDVLRQLAGTFLETSRDTDVLGRFDESSFLFFLPNTGPDGAEVMAQRIKGLANERGLTDIVGDPLEIAAGISFYPHVNIARREDLFGRARQAFFEARSQGTGQVVAS